MTWQTKCRSDSVITRHFDYTVQKCLHSVLNSSFMSLKKVIHFFYRIEFQQSVSSVLWIKNAPFLEIDENKDIEHFIWLYPDFTPTG